MFEATKNILEENSSCVFTTRFRNFVKQVSQTEFWTWVHD